MAVLDDRDQAACGEGGDAGSRGAGPGPGDARWDDDPPATGHRPRRHPGPGRPHQVDAPARQAQGEHAHACLWREAAEGAASLGDEPLSPREVAALAARLRSLDEPELPAGLVPRLAASLRAAARDPAVAGGTGEAVMGRDGGAVAAAGGVEGTGAGAAPVASAARPARRGRRARPVRPRAGTGPGWRALAGLLWAEARWLPMPFLVMQGVWLAAALALNAALAGYLADPPPPGARPAPGPAAGPQAGLVWGILAASADAFTLLAPWLGTLVALAACWPRRRSLWSDLEALSPFTPATRLLARAGVATAVATAAMLVAGLVQPPPLLAPVAGRLVPGAVAMLPAGAPASAGPAAAGPGAAGPALAAALLARTAPLWLAVIWALWWQLRAGTLASVAASAALWGTLTLAGRFLGPWNPLAVGPTGSTILQGLMLVAAALLLVDVRGRANGPAPSRTAAAGVPGR